MNKNKDYTENISEATEYYANFFFHKLPPDCFTEESVRNWYRDKIIPFEPRENRNSPYVTHVSSHGLSMTRDIDTVGLEVIAKFLKCSVKTVQRNKYDVKREEKKEGGIPVEQVGGKGICYSTQSSLQSCINPLKQ